MARRGALRVLVVAAFAAGALAGRTLLQDDEIEELAPLPEDVASVADEAAPAPEVAELDTEAEEPAAASETSCGIDVSAFPEGAHRDVACYAGAFLAKMLGELNAGHAKTVTHVRVHLLPYLGGAATLSALSTDSADDPSCTVCWSSPETAEGLGGLRESVPPAHRTGYDGLDVCYVRLTDRILAMLPQSDDGVNLEATSPEGGAEKQAEAMLHKLFHQEGFGDNSCPTDEPRPAMKMDMDMGGHGHGDAEEEVKADSEEVVPEAAAEGLEDAQRDDASEEMSTVSELAHDQPSEEDIRKMAAALAMMKMKGKFPQGHSNQRRNHLSPQQQTEKVIEEVLKMSTRVTTPR